MRSVDWAVANINLPNSEKVASLLQARLDAARRHDVVIERLSRIEEIVCY